MHAYDKKYCKLIVSMMQEGKSLAAFCAKIGISRQTAYDWRDAYPEFKESLEQAKEAGQAYWEDIGTNGIVGNYDKFGSSAWIFTMKNRFREDYKEEKQEQKSEDLSVLENILNGKITINK